MISLHHQVEQNLNLKYFTRKRIIKTFDPAGRPAEHTGKWEYHFLVLEGTNKELWAARVGHKTRIKYYQS